jgi:predicted glycogen debranching enzyme
MTTPDLREWLETDGLGGFTSGTAGLLRTRRYHALLLVATSPPTGRMVLVNGFDAVVTSPAGTWPLSTQAYPGGVLHPDGFSRIVDFRHEPWPTWRFRLTDDVSVVQEIVARTGLPRVVVRWRLEGTLPQAMLSVRPFLSGRDYHGLHHENTGFNFGAVPVGADAIEWSPYPGVSGVRSRSNGAYVHAPDWYRQFYYAEEDRRGLDAVEDLASPGRVDFDLSAGHATWIVEPTFVPLEGEAVVDLAARHVADERTRRLAFDTPLHRAADQYLVRRGDGASVIAGYPWFTDWGRDTFIAMRGLCLAAGRFDTARDILLAWARTVSEGMLPNRFPDGGDAPEFNAVDASLWFVVAIEELLDQAEPSVITGGDRARLLAAVDAIVSGYAHGTRYGIRADDDGLLMAGVPGVQLTWMDAKVGDDVVTPRIGKPVEVQALWLAALAFAGRTSEIWRALRRRAAESFEQKFWNDAAGCLYDVVDVDHVRGRVDASIRPNQIFAVGGLPTPALKGTRARRVVDVVEQTLVTPMGLRSLAPADPAYRRRYEGGVWERDHAYHQGTVWPWLMGAFVDAWLRVRDEAPAAVLEAEQRFLAPLARALEDAGLGHLAEIADAEAPFTPRGCPFQAWSVGELLRARRHLARLSASNEVQDDENVVLPTRRSGASLERG